MFKSFGKSDAKAPIAVPVNGVSNKGMDAANRVTSSALRSR